MDDVYITTIGPGSPTRLLCMNECQAGFNPNSIQIWAIKPDGSLELEFEDTSVPCCPPPGPGRLGLVAKKPIK